MKRFLFFGIGIPVVVAVGVVLVAAAFTLWDRYYWWASPDLGRAFHAAGSESVDGEPIQQLEGLNIEDARARAEGAEFACIPRSAGLYCTRFLADVDCGEDWFLLLDAEDGRISKATATKRLVCS